MQAPVLDSIQTMPQADVSLSLSRILYPDLEQDSSLEPGSASSVPSFQVDSMAKADWAVSRVLDSRARIARREDLAIALHTRIDAWLSKANTTDVSSITFLSSLLLPFVSSEVSKQHRSRSLLLPSGSIGLRKSPDHLEITDRDTALAYCKVQHPEAVIIKEDLSRSAVKALVFNGEAIPGVIAELGQDTLYINSNS